MSLQNVIHLRSCLLQAVHYLATGAKTRDMAQTSALASLTQSLYAQKT